MPQNIDSNFDALVYAYADTEVAVSYTHLRAHET